MLSLRPLNPGLLLLALASLSAVAQAEPPDSSTITVTGKAVTRAQLREATGNYVRKALANTINGQHARWNDPVCPRVVGLREPAAARFTDRVVQAASVLKLRIEPVGCKPNILVIFTPDANAMMQAIQRQSPQIFDQTPIAELRRLIDGKAPVRWFYSSTQEGADGQLIGGGGGAAGASAIATNVETNVLNTGRASRIDTGAQVSLIGATLVIESPQVMGYDLDAVAAHAVMTALARIRFGAKDVPGDSILSLYDHADPATRPVNLTMMDEAFLFALYGTPAALGGKDQKAQMVSRIVESIETGTMPQQR